MHSSEDVGDYRRVVTKLFLAERIAFGVPVLVGVMDLFVRASLLWMAMHCSNNFPAADVLRPRQLDMQDVVGILIALGLANAVHMWSALKG